MSIKTTHRIDRQTALAVVLSKISSLTNNELEEILEIFPESHFRNYLVHDELQDDDRTPVIRNISEF